MRILYVEDNPANLSLMQRIARMGGHDVVSYTEGEIALDRYAQDNPDLILLDVQLAGKLTGVDVVKKLREMGVTKPVIAVTAYAMVGDKERFLESGFDAYLSKPLPVTELVELVQKYELQLKPVDGVKAAPAVAAAPAAVTSAPAAAAAPAPAVAAEAPSAPPAPTAVSAPAAPSPAAAPADGAAPVAAQPPAPTAAPTPVDPGSTQADRSKALGDVDLAALAAKADGKGSVRD